jgi:hypothetical protein
MVYDTVARTDSNEVRATIAGFANIPPLEVEFEDVLVSVDGTQTRSKVVQATLHRIDSIDRVTAERVLAAWAVLEDQPRYRLRAGKTVAWYTPETQTGCWYDRVTDEEFELTSLDGVWPEWLTAADALLTAGEAADERAPFRLA